MDSTQLAILTKLLRSNGIRYSDIWPREVENDLFNYHLQYLVKKGLVEKRDNLYYLSFIGKKFVEEIIPIDPVGQSSDLFRVNILACVVRTLNKKLEVLNQTRTRHPFYGDKGIIGGTVKKGEFVLDAAKRKLCEETGLEAKFKSAGIIRKIRLTAKNELFTDIFFHVCFADLFTGDLISKNGFGENYWVDIDTAIENEAASNQGGVCIVNYLKTLKTENPAETPFFFEEETIVVKP